MQKTMEEEFQEKIREKDAQIAQLESDNLVALEAITELYELTLGGI